MKTFVGLLYFYLLQFFHHFDLINFEKFIAFITYSLVYFPCVISVKKVCPFVSLGGNQVQELTRLF